MKLVIAGGSGQIGQLLIRHFLARGDECLNLTRRPESAIDVLWNGKDPGDWVQSLENADVLINLSGRTVNCRYTESNKQQILQSRIESTQALAKAIAICQSPPRVWLQSSTATIYDHRFDQANDETTGIINDQKTGKFAKWNFSIQVAKGWETAAYAIPLPHTRLVLLRSAMVMTPDAGGVFSVLQSLTKKGLGGTMGSGEQYVSWIHGLDFIRSIEYLIANQDLEGAVNLAAPNPLPNRQFMQALRQAAGMPFGLPASDWMLEIGAFLMRTETELLLKSRRVIPKRLLDHGFQFEFPEWHTAALDLCNASVSKK